MGGWKHIFIGGMGRNLDLQPWSPDGNKPSPSTRLLVKDGYSCPWLTITERYF